MVVSKERACSFGHEAAASLPSPIFFCIKVSVAIPAPFSDADRRFAAPFVSTLTCKLNLIAASCHSAAAAVAGGRRPPRLPLFPLPPSSSFQVPLFPRPIPTPTSGRRVCFRFEWLLQTVQPHRRTASLDAQRPLPPSLPPAPQAGPKGIYRE